MNERTCGGCRESEHRAAREGLREAFPSVPEVLVNTKNYLYDVLGRGMKKDCHFLPTRPIGQIRLPTQITETENPMSDLALEKHFTPTEVGALWHKDAKVIRGLFEREPGVLLIDRPETRNKRRYRSLSIPESVVRRVHARLSSR
jgi:hypothetical protein